METRETETMLNAEGRTRRGTAMKLSRAAGARAERLELMEEYRRRR